MNSQNVTVVIPAKNEQNTIGKVIQVVKENKNVNQIIVVNNNSTDNTEKIAKKLGVQVVFCEKEGKGYALEKGMEFVDNEIVAFIDADIKNYPKNLIGKIINPILNDEADFVKSMFERKGGRVTELVAKPLLSITFPNIYKFAQPLSGMIAGKKAFFEKMVFEKDYGVDIGILLDMIKYNARIIQVDIGRINNKSKDWRNLNQMSKEVMQAILKRRYN